MAQVEKFIHGKANWAKIFKGQEDKEYKYWGLDLVLDNSQQKQFEDWDCELHLRDGKEADEKFIRLRRPTVKMIKDKAVNFDPPAVLGPDNKPWPDNTAIGNGSEVTCKVVVYDSRKGKGVRLEAVRVDVHVPYSAKEVDTSNVDSPF